MADFGSGLGGLIGSGLAASDLSSGMGAVNSTAGNIYAATEPYNQFGQSFLPQASNAVTNLSAAAGSVPQFGDFMKDFSLSPGAQYTLGQATEAQNNSAAAQGGLLSGTNERALTGITNGIVSNDIAQQYGLTLAGNQQQFGQLQSVLGDMFQGIGVGTTATGQQTSAATAQMAQQSALAQAQAKNDQGKGSGIGSMFSGIGSAAAKF